MPFSLKNAPAVFSKIFIATFCDFIHRFLEFYMDEWTVYSLLKEYVGIVWLMFDRCCELQIDLNLRNCILCVPHENLLGHIDCQEGVLVDPTKFFVILNMSPPTSVKQLRMTLGNTGYYRRFIRRYSSITTPLEKLMNKYEAFRWTTECNKAFDTLKEKLGTTPTLIYPNWNIEFHVHMDALGVVLGAILAQPREGNMDQPIYFSSIKLSQAEGNYKTTEREGLAMIYALKFFLHYLLDSHFKFFTNHSVLKYHVNNHVLEGRICKWLLLFQDFSLEVIVKLGRCNVGLDHLSRLESGESVGVVDDHLLNTDLFHIESIP
jgi:hypothetical protein